MSEVKLQPHYDNSNGSLYKIAKQRQWDAYIFDAVKRLDRLGKKDSVNQEILKTIGVLVLRIDECNDNEFTQQEIQLLDNIQSALTSLKQKNDQHLNAKNQEKFHKT